MQAKTLAALKQTLLHRCIDLAQGSDGMVTEASQQEESCSSKWM